ncbi:MAG: hypothetical protein Q9226_001996 [Calogaya cf. arnoldii]
MAPAAGKNNEAMDTLVVGIANLNIQPRGLYSLPNELLQPIMDSFENNRETLKSIRLVCANINDLARPLLFKNFRIRCHPNNWRTLFRVIVREKIARNVKSLEIAASPAASAVRFDGIQWPPKADPFQLDIECLKLYDYRCLLKEPIWLNLDRNRLTTLHIDTTTCLLNEEIARCPKSDTWTGWQPKFGDWELENLRHLTITQDPFASPAVDVLALLDNVFFGSLENVELNSVRSSHFDPFLTRCRSSDRGTLRRVWIRRPFLMPYFDGHWDLVDDWTPAEDKRIIFLRENTYDAEIADSMGFDWVNGLDLVPQSAGLAEAIGEDD